MPKFVVKPPTVHAVQWDGTKEGVRVILDEWQKHFPNISLGYLYTHRRDFDGRDTCDLVLSTNLIDKDLGRMLKGHWLVITTDVYRDPGVKIIHDELFREMYDKVSDE